MTNDTIRAIVITSKHPVRSSPREKRNTQANGQVEHKNQEVEAYLCLFISKCQDDWVDLLPTVEFIVNSQLNSATGHTPFELLYGYTPDFTIPAG